MLHLYFWRRILEFRKIKGTIITSSPSSRLNLNLHILGKNVGEWKKHTTTQSKRYTEITTPISFPYGFKHFWSVQWKNGMPDEIKLSTHWSPMIWRSLYITPLILIQIRFMEKPIIYFSWMFCHYQVDTK